MDEIGQEQIEVEVPLDETEAKNNILSNSDGVEDEGAWYYGGPGASNSGIRNAKAGAEVINADDDVVHNQLVPLEADAELQLAKADIKEVDVEP